MAIRSIEVYEELKNGGEWLGAARHWMQSNINRGDTLHWDSGECVCQYHSVSLKNLQRQLQLQQLQQSDKEWNKN